MKVNAWRVSECDPSLLNTIGLLYLGLNGCEEVTDGCLLKMVNRCSLEVSVEVTDAGVTALSHGCGQLQSINLTNCLVTDAGVTALSHGCGQL